MSASFSPENAPFGDVGTALLCVDSRLTQLRGEAKESDEEQRELVNQVLDSFDAKGANDVIDGTCTLLYLFMDLLRQIHAEQGHNAINSVVPQTVETLRAMPNSVQVEAIPTMSGMLTAAAIGLSPTLWRKQYGPWTSAEMNALEATVFLLADNINRIAEDDNAATRMISNLLESVAAEDDTP